MESNWNELDADNLKALYEKESLGLRTALLNGATWEEVKDQRQRVTELSIALHKKINTSGNPAESTDRSEKRVTR
jgi:hypothetical protein